MQQSCRLCEASSADGGDVEKALLLTRPKGEREIFSSMRSAGLQLLTMEISNSPAKSVPCVSKISPL